MNIHLSGPIHAVQHALLVVLLLVPPVRAEEHPALDSFGVSGPQVGTYIDEFDDGIPPPFGGTWSASGTGKYAVNPKNPAGNVGFLPNAETDGLLHFNPLGVGVACNIGWSCVPELDVTLLTDTTPGSRAGLRKADDFHVYANWLLTRSVGNEYYRLRLSDGQEGIGINDIVEIRAVHGDGRSALALGIGDHKTGVIRYSEIGAIPDGYADHVLMDFSHRAGDDFVSAGVRLFKGTEALGHVSLGTAKLFNGGDYTLAGFGYVYILPEPGSVALMLGGLAILGIATRQRRPGTH